MPLDPDAIQKNDDIPPIDNRLGKLKFSPELVLQESLAAAQVLALIQFVPLEAEYHPGDGCYRYMGISPRFEPVGEGMPPPDYALLVHTDQGQLTGVDVTPISPRPGVVG